MSAQQKAKTDKDNSQTQDAPPVNLTPEQHTKVMTACVLGWLIPGAGHLYLGKFVKGISFFVLLNGLFLWGMALHGEIAFPILDLHSPEFNLVNILVFIVGLGNGLMTFLNLIPKINMGNIALHTYEVGTLFMVVSGSMNVFAVFNVWDLFVDDVVFSGGKSSR